MHQRHSPREPSPTLTDTVRCAASSQAMPHTTKYKLQTKEGVTRRKLSEREGGRRGGAARKTAAREVSEVR